MIIKEEDFCEIIRLAGKERKTRKEISLKLVEEVGEAVQALLCYIKTPGCEYKGKTEEDIIEECIDIQIVSISLIGKIDAELGMKFDRMEKLVDGYINTDASFIDIALNISKKTGSINGRHLSHNGIKFDDMTEDSQECITPLFIMDCCDVIGSAQSLMIKCSDKAESIFKETWDKKRLKWIAKAGLEE